MTEQGELLNGGLTVKERLQRIEDGIFRIEAAVTNKAEKEDVLALRDRVSSLETRLAVYEERNVRTVEDVIDARKAVVDIKKGQTDIYKALKYATATVIGVITASDVIIRFFTR